MTQKLSAKQWSAFFADVGLDATVADSYLTYISKLARRRLPVIFEFGHLARLLGRTDAYLASVLNSAARHYRTFRIPKRRGGTREIAAPYPALLECQRWINAEILARVPVHQAAHGFMRKKSIVSNAKAHAGDNELLKIDIENFFPSISIARVIGIFRQLGYPPNVAFYLARLCCLDDRLPQGAATSPAISNIVFYKSDVRLAALAKSFQLTYTRYADDLAFSGETVPMALTRYVTSILAEEGFAIRRDKTRLSTGNQRKMLTGLLVNGEKPRIPSELRRSVTRDVYYIRKFGYLSHVGRRKIGDPLYLDRLHGRLLYWRYVEGPSENLNDMIESIAGIIRSYRDLNG